MSHNLQTSAERVHHPAPFKKAAPAVEERRAILSVRGIFEQPKRAMLEPHRHSCALASTDRANRASFSIHSDDQNLDAGLVDEGPPVVQTDGAVITDVVHASEEAALLIAATLQGAMIISDEEGLIGIPRHWPLIHMRAPCKGALRRPLVNELFCERAHHVRPHGRGARYALPGSPSERKKVLACFSRRRRTSLLSDKLAGDGRHGPLGRAVRKQGSLHRRDL